MCNECHGGFDCPICGVDVDVLECEACDGCGIIYFTEEKGDVSYSEWLLAPENERGFEKCTACNGTGEIEY